jgi:Tfp pilus assembly protein PilO
MGLDLTYIDWKREPSVRERVYFGVVFVLCIFLMAKMWWAPVQKDVAVVNAQRNSVELQSDALKDLISATKKQVRKAVDRTVREDDAGISDARVKRILERQSVNAPEEIAMVTHLMSARDLLGNLVFRGVDVAPAREAATHAIVPLKVYVQGSFSSIGRFIRRLEGIERPLMVNSLKLSQISNRPGIVNAELNVYLYVHKSGIVHHAAVDDAEKEKQGRKKR